MKNVKCGCTPKVIKPVCPTEIIPEPVCDPASQKAIGLYNGYAEDYITGNKYSIGQIVNDPDGGNAKFMSLRNCNNSPLPSTTDENWFRFKNTEYIAPEPPEDVYTDGMTFDTTTRTLELTRTAGKEALSVVIPNAETCNQVDFLRFESCLEMSEYEGTEQCPLRNRQLAIVAGDEGCMEIYRYVNITTINELDGEACGKYVGSVSSTVMKWIEYLECDGRVPDLMECVLPVGRPSLCERVTELEAKKEFYVTGARFDAGTGNVIITRNNGLEDIEFPITFPVGSEDNYVTGVDMDDNNLRIHRNNGLDDLIIQLDALAKDKYTTAMEIHDGKLILKRLGMVENLEVELPSGNHLTDVYIANGSYKFIMENGEALSAPLPEDVKAINFTTDEDRGEYEIALSDGQVLRAPFQEDRYVTDIDIIDHHIPTGETYKAIRITMSNGALLHARLPELTPPTPFGFYKTSNYVKHNHTYGHNHIVEVGRFTVPTSGYYMINAEGWLEALCTCAGNPSGGARRMGGDFLIYTTQDILIGRITDATNITPTSGGAVSGSDLVLNTGAGTKVIRLWKGNTLVCKFRETTMRSEAPVNVKVHLAFSAIRGG